MLILPAYAHISLQSFVRQGFPPASTVPCVGIHAPVGCGIQGCGVRTPKAAAVAAATCGFAMDEHIPNGGMFDMLVASCMVAIGLPPASAVCWLVTFNVEVPAPKLQIILAPVVTSCPMILSPF